jgi:hypothetical protein
MVHARQRLHTAEGAIGEADLGLVVDIDALLAECLVELLERYHQRRPPPRRLAHAPVALDHRRDLCLAERLAQRAEHAQAELFGHVGHRGHELRIEPRQQHDAGLDVACGQTAQGLHAIDAGHRQVAEQQIDRPLGRLQRAERGDAVLGLQHAADALVHEHRREQLADRARIVDQHRREFGIVFAHEPLLRHQHRCRTARRLPPTLVPPLRGRSTQVGLIYSGLRRHAAAALCTKPWTSAPGGCAPACAGPVHKPRTSCANHYM